MGNIKKDFLDLESLRDENGRISSEDFGAYIRAAAEAEYEERRPELEELNAKKKKAAEELVELGLSKESAYLITGYTEN